jgi:hypothetical protein
MADRDTIAQAMMELMRREELHRQIEAATLADQEHQRSLGAAGRPDPNAMPFVKPDGFGFPAQIYQDYRTSGLPKQYAIEDTRNDMQVAPHTMGWGDIPEEAPGS